MRVSAQEAIDTGGIENRRREDAAEDDAEKATDTVDAPHVERVIPLQLVFQGHGVEADDAGNESDQASGRRRDISRRRGDGGQSGHCTGQKAEEARLLELSP